jgi:hypothetical protein
VDRSPAGNVLPLRASNSYFLRCTPKLIGMQQPVEKLTSEALSVDQLLEYLPALKEVARAQLDNWAKGAAVPDQEI